jgi:hypothetical protein
MGNNRLSIENRAKILAFALISIIIYLILVYVITGIIFSFLGYPFMPFSLEDAVVGVVLVTYIATIPLLYPFFILMQTYVYRSLLEKISR